MTPLQNAIIQNDLRQVTEILTAFPSSATETQSPDPLPSLMAAQYGSLKSCVTWSNTRGQVLTNMTLCIETSFIMPQLPGMFKNAAI